jgi:tRNA 2-thiouridine synthesizing protein A
MGTREPEASADSVAEIDARGLACPQPVLMLRQALAQVRVGERVVLLATDPLAPLDVAAWCLRTRHTLVSQIEQDGTYRFVVQREDRPATG